MQRHSRSHCGLRPRPVGEPEQAEAQSGRFLSCVRCGVHSLICRYCDRGQIYFAGDCAQEARRSAQRAASRRYQASRRGRFAHASRARRYRARQKIVTHHGSPPRPPDDLVPAGSAAVADDQSFADSVPQRLVWRCQWCGRRCTEFVRREFLRRRRVPRTVARHDRRGTDDDDTA